MSHFLRMSERPHWPTVLGKPRAAVTVKASGDGAQLHIHPDTKTGLPFTVARGDVNWAPLPERCSVLGPDGEAVGPSSGRRFYVSMDTIDPFHMVMEHE